MSESSTDTSEKRAPLLCSARIASAAASASLSRLSAENNVTRSVGSGNSGLPAENRCRSRNIASAVRLLRGSENGLVSTRQPQSPASAVSDSSAARSGANTSSASFSASARSAIVTEGQCANIAFVSA